ncbi:hypothetical protein OA58_17325 [Microcystis aeruginosa NIES-88]|nr:hypothetical protein OA58_17325 [Microcystis aeruginosa NIES-88]BCU11457.1 hypothetical protein MAN88_20210 [Microcystis aeruginosa]
MLLIKPLKKLKREVEISAIANLVGCVFAATNSDEKPKLTIRTRRSKFIIKLVRYAFALYTLRVVSC